ncbi:mas-related G-protein coupled receptor member D-like [Agelaius tricolor]|uniref:mas-related G-protein coupled receptor member D-like n=1 Tax=Agelaius tricolor TaxID=9191 RepID=UPI0039F234EC
MEVTTVSPSPASPTEEDHLCETDATTVAIHSVTLLICLCGLAGNGAVCRFLCYPYSSMKSTNRWILVLTLLDFLFLLILLPSPLLFLVEDVSCSIILPLQYVWFLFQVPLVSYTFCLYTLTFVSILRCRSIHCPLWLCCHRPQHLSWVVHALLGAFLITLIAIFATMISLCFVQQSEHCWVSLISMHAFNLLLCTPFLLISSTILFTHFKPGSQKPQPRRLDIVICLIVLFTLPLSLWNLLEYLGYTIVPSQVAFLLTCIHSSGKPIIYFLVGRCWRPCSLGSLQLSLQRVFEEPEGNTAHSHHPAMDTVL